MKKILFVVALFIISQSRAELYAQSADWRNIENALSEIPDENYCDQPYAFIARNGYWVCTLTTGTGGENGSGTATAAHVSDISLSGIYSDNMVVQADQPFVIEGQSTPLKEVRVRILNNIVKDRAGPDGKWKARFPGVPKNTSFDINIISSEREEKVIRNVIAGQVWLCSGQSNMGMPVSASDVREKLKDSDVHEIRYFLAQNDPSETELDQVRGHWVICTAQTISGCSAVGLSFAWHLHQLLQQPVGLIINAVGGTPIESWTPLAIVKEKEYNRHIFLERQQWKKDRIIYENEYALKIKNREIAAQQAKENGRLPPAKIYPPFQLRDNWNPGSLYNSLVCPVRDFVFKGVIGTRANPMQIIHLCTGTSLQI